MSHSIWFSSESRTETMNIKWNIGYFQIKIYYPIILNQFRRYAKNDVENVCVVHLLLFKFGTKRNTYKEIKSFLRSIHSYILMDLTCIKRDIIFVKLKLKLLIKLFNKCMKVALHGVRKKL